MSTTPVLDLYEIDGGLIDQAVQHNEALRMIEARLVRVLSRTTNAPPGSPAEGDSYILTSGRSGVWLADGAEHDIASFIGGDWVYYTPIEGVGGLWVNDENVTITFDSAAWVASGAGSFQPLDADLTAIAGLTATTDNFMQAKSSAWASRTVAQVTADLQGTGLDVDAVGFRGIPINSQSGNYTTVATDAGREILHPSGAGAGDTFTIDSNANVAYEDGATITFVNMDSNPLSIAITSDTMYREGTGATGTRTLAQYGSATAVKQTSTTWLISGGSALT